ncbi:caffeoylshikimate esterase [Beta vulgaris subsp. vulgaris]|uniref:caffeoylshikimate esterase n=1 Tax=Beta vulgaris subsp. vulgaris TaxID=3555 RepID=UPI0020367BF8|nr:caffeoylshikimate esterase [Beta vulgaris subsp. vulgaris]
MGSNVKYEEEYIVNNNGLMLFTCRWLPQDQDPKALIFLCHGYAMESSISMRGTANRLVKAGYGVYGIDYIGHGKSDGLPGLVSSFEELVQDCSDHFTKVCEREENKGKKRFMMGESMGGAVLLLLHRKMPDFWDGGILVAPMCKIADDMKPNPYVTNFLTKLSDFVPTWKIVPGQDVIEVAIRDPERKKEARANPYWYTGRLRLKTAHELLNVSNDLEKRLNEVTLPFIVLHGEDDKVTDPEVSKLLYESAASFDKTFKLYPGMWHALTFGELPENINTVFNDIIGWLDERTRGNNSRLESINKSREDTNANITVK